jgi:hypothetical protein
MPHGSRTIPTELDRPEAALESALRRPAALQARTHNPKVAGSNPAPYITDGDGTYGEFLAVLDGEGSDGRESRVVLVRDPSQHLVVAEDVSGLRRWGCLHQGDGCPVVGGLHHNDAETIEAVRR